LPLSHALKDAFLIEIEKQCKFGIMASYDLENALKSHNMDRLWYSVQGILLAAGNISKLLWPSNPQSVDRGNELRTLLSVVDRSALTPRTFRNHFEHFDERLEQWASSSTRHNIVDSSVLPPGVIKGIDAGDFLRNLDPTSGSVTFRGDSYDLRPVVQEIIGLWQRVTQEIVKTRYPQA
jgi:hypothetical protein